MKNKIGSKFGIGIKYGIITAGVYVLLLLVQYLFCSNSPVIYTGSKIIGYFVLVVCFVLAGMAKRKEMGGFAEMKELFQTIFITVIFAELAFVVFSYIYLNFIDPSFMERYTETLMVFLNEKKAAMTENNFNEQVKAIAQAKNDHKSITSLLRQLVNSIVLDSIIGLVIAYALKRKRPENGYVL